MNENVPLSLGDKVPGPLRSHFVGFALLLPFLGMFGLHRYLGLSFAMNVPTPPGERDAPLYNLVMCLVFYGGVSAYFSHAIVIAKRSKGWLAFKLLFLVAYWVGVLQLLRPS